MNATNSEEDGVFYIHVSWIKNVPLRRVVLVVTIPILLLLCVFLCGFGVLIWWVRVLTGLYRSFIKVWRMP